MRVPIYSFVAFFGGAALILSSFTLVVPPERAQANANDNANANGGDSSSEIYIGSSLPLGGAFSAVGQETKAGMEAAFRVANEKGGIFGAHLNLVTLGDGYDPLLCVQNTLQLIETNKVLALCSYVGTPTSLKAAPVWQGAKVPVVGFYTGARVLREPFNRYNIHIRPSYEQETKAAVDVFAGKFQAKTFAILYQDDSFGDAVKTATEKALRERGLAPVASGTFVRNTLHVEEAVDRIAAAAPDVVVLAGTYAPLARAIDLAKGKGLSKTIFYTVSFVGPEALAGALGSGGDHVVVSEVLPLYTDTKQPIVAAYLAALRGRAPSFPSFEGYLNARVVIEGLQRAGKHPTHESLIDAIETIRDNQIEPGLEMAYGPNDHEGLSTVHLISLDNGKWKEIETRTIPDRVAAAGH
ncbi:amino acid/amide ABC transporter substrate-binding protein, HAAT family [Verrucomicrobium sp. GAS474]|uniref:ABC transporter substrate-binding protein n=1 Tax=Verrucomicrobium sp. GAS474 TaxID=1882831 RepID=UPI00087D19CD|nr:ABC transporter substrate-binding protein [Verrucomicrobium sp. GAS474]SDU04070.1 amino acid/amide ABC transporter substrate-binding protein, HAAT family [Verrucomicrobium sp. GAS474]